jgi:hypothetical protein
MAAMEKGRLVKAQQAAQLLTADLREVMTKTDCMALEIVALDMLEQVVKIDQRLRRLAEAARAKPERNGPTRPMRIMTDDEFLAAVADKGNPDDMNRAFLELWRQGRIQIFDDSSGDLLIVTVEQTN